MQSGTGLLTLTIVGAETTRPTIGREVNKWLDDCGTECGRGFSCGDLYWIDWRGLGVFAFSVGAHEVRVWPEPKVTREAIRQTFSRVLQPVILQALGWQALHAGATMGPAGVVAFCGTSGSGKSTLAFAMQQIGWPQFADDALVLRFDGDSVLACPLAFTPRLRPPSRLHFAQTRSKLASAPERHRSDAPLAAVFLVRQDPALTSPRVSLVPQAGAFSQLLAHAHCFDTEDPKHTRQLVNDYLRLCAHVPIFTLEYCPEFRHLAQVTRAIVDKTGGSASSSELRSAALLP